MPSKVPPEKQVIIRCLDHRPIDGIATPYVAYVAPSGDGEAVRCRKCHRHGVIMMTEDAYEAWSGGARMFYPRTDAVCIMAGDEAVWL